MPSVVIGSDILPANPLDLVEEVALGRDWQSDRVSDMELAVEVPGHWCNYGLFFAWAEDMGALHFSCALDMRVPDRGRPQVLELINLLNERLWMGHFALWTEQNLPVFRHTLLITELTAGRDMLNSVIDMALAEAERFYPAFQFIIWGGKTAAEAIEAAMLDTVGQA
ncbi:type III secretion system chaperone family protein [Novispirillum itersonii]|uniref:YbjN domain-containing protein n=1 Tax=Novispirillum itersonii TaxID=189 RepID=UPI000374BF87|nr:YbjN domain-containing protein [Novispirillum itersonii]